MPLRNGDHGYGGVSKALHWLTVGLIVAQLLVGYSMSTEDPAAEAAADRAHEAGERCEATQDTDAAEAEEERCEEAADRREDALDERAGDDGASPLHVGLGLAILLLGVARVLWRRVGGLPPWAEALSPAERTLEAWLEKGLLLSLFLMPLSGLWLVLGDGPVAVHVATHVGFFVVVALHVGLVLKHTVVQRDRHLARML